MGKTIGIVALLLALFVIALNAYYQQTITHIDTDQKVIALTFDDGPNPPYTNQLLKILDKHQVKATFFFLGRNIEMHRNSALLVQNRGHEIGNHGYLHIPLGWKSPQASKKGIAKTDLLIRSLGYTGPIFFRSPFGSRGIPLAFALHQMNRPQVLYSISPSPPDYFRSDPTLMHKSILKQVHPGSIVVLHDGEGIRTETLSLADKLIGTLKTQKFRFVTVSEILKLQKNI